MHSFLRQSRRYINLIDSHLSYPLLLFTIVFITHLAFALSHIPFSQDYGRDLHLVQQWIDQGQYIVPYGPKTSVGNFFVFPLYYQLLLIVQFIFDHPLAMNLLVTFLESFTPVILFACLRYFVSKKFAFLGGLIYALSALVIGFSTNTWSPNLIPFLSTVALYSWLTFLFKNQKKYLTIGPLALALALHLHFQVVVLLPFALIVFFISLKRDRRNIFYWLLGAGVAFVTYAPYLITEVLTNWPNTREIISFYTQEHSQYFDRISKPEYILSFLPAFMGKVLFNTVPFSNVLGKLIFFAGSSLLLAKAVKMPRYRWLGFYLLCIFVMLRVYRGDKHEYYLMTLFIMPSILIAIILESTIKQSKVIAGAITLCLLILLTRNLQNPGFNSLATIQSSVTTLIKEVPPGQSTYLFSMI